jgi:hypothetical protein
MPQLMAYCSKEEQDEYMSLSREKKEEINKKTRAYRFGLVRKAKAEMEVDNNG